MSNDGNTGDIDSSNDSALDDEKDENGEKDENEDDITTTKTKKQSVNYASSKKNLFYLTNWFGP